jgi:hypothetical protein
LFFKLLFNVNLIYSTHAGLKSPGFGAIGHFLSSVVGQRKGPSGANAPPVHGIKTCLAGTFKKTRNDMPVISLFVTDIAFCPTILIIVAWGND